MDNQNADSKNQDRHRQEMFTKILPALSELLNAIECANDSCVGHWQFAISIMLLKQCGMNEVDMRWMLTQGLAEHAREITDWNDDERMFKPGKALIFNKRSCFILTSLGIAKARSLLNTETVAEVPASHTPSESQLIQSQCLPTWDAETRELSFNSKLVKRFKWQAFNQELVLNAFQEDSWASRIDDPLPPKAEQCPKRRLSDTIKCLNKKQENRLIRFRGDGTGEGVVWEHLESKA